MDNYELYMQKAIELAVTAEKLDEVPVGCVVVNSSGEIVGKGYNRCESSHDATAHAELEAIKDASKARKDWRLDDCTLVVTMEPCPMCAGAIINSRIHTLVYGVKDDNKGSCGSVIDLFSENYNHRIAIYSGIKEEENRTILKEFFNKKR